MAFWLVDSHNMGGKRIYLTRWYRSDGQDHWTLKIAESNRFMARFAAERAIDDWKQWVRKAYSERGLLVPRELSCIIARMRSFEYIAPEETYWEIDNELAD